MKKPLLILTLLIIGVYQHVQAQYMLGTTGMMNIPTADRQKPGTVMLGGNYLPKQVMPSRFNYNTGNYFVSISFFFLSGTGIQSNLDQRRLYVVQAQIQSAGSFLFHPAMCLERRKVSAGNCTGSQ